MYFHLKEIVMSNQSMAAQLEAVAPFIPKAETSESPKPQKAEGKPKNRRGGVKERERRHASRGEEVCLVAGSEKAKKQIDDESIPGEVVAYQDAAVKSVQNGLYRIKAPQVTSVREKQQGKIRAPQLGGMGKQHNGHAKPGVVNVQVLKPKPQIRQSSLTLCGLTWEDKREEIVLVINDSPFGELVIKLESAKKWDGPFVCILKKTPSNLALLTQANIEGVPGWQSLDLPQVFILQETPWGRMAFSIGKAKDSDTPFVRVLR